MSHAIAFLRALAVAGLIAAGPTSALAASPGRILFSRWDDALGDFQAFTVASDGTGETLVLPGAHEIPHWSPDGGSLVTTAVTAAGQVVPAIVAADGTGYRELPVEPGLNLGCAAWTADGTHLLCEGWSDGDPSLDGIRSISAVDGGDVTRLTQVHDVPGGLSPDGATIVFVRPVDGTDGGTLWLMDADGRHQRQLGTATVGLQVGYSPDGTSILADDTQGHLFTVAVADGAVTPIAIPGAGAYEATWSPDGAWIAFAMFAGQGTTPDLYAMRLDGTGLTQLTDTPGVVDEAPDWSPG
ncbi:MAG: hypothetical protein U0869_07910 [Chloroflexota bacterium]